MLQTAESKRDREGTSTPPGVCDNQVLDRSQTLDSKDGEMSEVEGARLESEACQRYQATPKRLNAHVISDLTFQNDHSVCVRKPRCSSGF